MIPDEIVDEIRQRADLVAVISRHVQLKKSGRSFKGLCPFHGEKTPSFHVHPDRGFYYCFGCQAKGDVFSFLRDYEGKSFVEAVETLAAELGVAIPETSRGAGERRSRRRELFDINRAASDFYRKALAGAEGRDAREYLERRGIGAEICDRFQLGYAPNAWGELSEHLRAIGEQAELAESAGLVVPKKSGRGYYDRFRDRVMCPVATATGEIAGFSGRLVHPDDKAAKYINSPESPVYKKSKLLFGLHLARPAIREKGRALLVEGNFDVIGLHQAGFAETIAPLGTALTEEQVGQLSRMTDKVVLLYDGDRAGRIAAYKALLALVTTDVEVEIAVLDEGEDPDSAVANKGVEYLATVIDSSRPALEYFIYDVWVKGGGSADRRARALEAAAALIRNIRNPTKRDLISGTLASAMGVPTNLVAAAVSRAQTSTPRVEKPRNSQRVASKMPPRLELDILAIIADHPQLLEIAEQRDVISHLTDERLRDMYSAARSGQPIHAALSALETDDPMTSQIVQHILSGDWGAVKDPAHALAEAITRLLQLRKRARLERLQQQADEAGRRGDTALQRKLVKEIVETRRQVD